MCQLLGMNANKPASLHFSLQGFMRRGGDTDEHQDGWGIAYWADTRWKLFLDSQPSAHSPLAERLHRRAFKSRNTIVHIRKATQGAIKRQNCHPFTRQLWGRQWVFAHNGNLVDFAPQLDGSFLPQGDTDSERAFCYLLQQLRQYFAHQPDDAILFEALAAISRGIASHGTFNYLFSAGDSLFAHCSTELHHVARAYPFQSVQLLDSETNIDLGAHNHLDDCMSIVVTKPLTRGESWQAFRTGELKHFRNGVETCCGVRSPSPVWSV